MCTAAIAAETDKPREQLRLACLHTSLREQRERWGMISQIGAFNLSCLVSLMLALAGAVFAFCPTELQAERRRFICAGRKTKYETVGLTQIYLQDDLIIFGSSSTPCINFSASSDPQPLLRSGAPF